MDERRLLGPALRRPLAVAALVAASVGVAASMLGGAARPAEAAGLPRCAHPVGHAPLPASLASFPLPAGTVIERRQAKYGYTIYSGHVPGAINPVRDFFVSRLPSAGYRLGAGDAEAAEAEADYAGHGARGRWKVRAVYGCPGALTIQIAVR
jgi:hypothetical protein